VTWSASGLPAGLSIDAGTGAISGTLSYGDANAGPDYAVTVIAGDGTYSGSQTFNLHVVNSMNMAPTVTNPGAQGNQAGDNIDFFLSASDSNGDALTFSETGLPDGLSLDSNTGEIYGTVADDAVSSTPYAVVATVDNGQDGTGTQTFGWIITAAPLAAAAGSSISAVEGNDTGSLTLATFTTPDLNSMAGDFTAVVDWGDGTSDNGTVDGSNGSFTVTDDHVYAAPGSYSVSVAITAPTGAVATSSMTATVAAAPLTLTGMTLGAIVNQSSTLTLAGLTDGNPAATSSAFTVTIDWGDGSATSTGTASCVNGSYQLTGTHTYSADGTYTTTVTVTDASGATASANSTVQVGDLFAGVPSTLTVATFSDANPSATPANFTATVTWDDGTSLSGTVTKSAGVFTVTGNHTYAVDSLDETGGVYHVNVAVADNDGNSLSYAKPVEVVRPVISLLVNNVATDASGSLTNVLLGSFTEPDASDASTEFSVSVNWGDGSSPGTATVTGTDGNFQIWGSHSYSGYGDFPVNVTVSQSWSVFAPAVSQMLLAQAPKQKAPIPELDVAQSKGVGGKSGVFGAALFFKLSAPADKISGGWLLTRQTIITDSPGGITDAKTSKQNPGWQGPDTFGGVNYGFWQAGHISRGKTSQPPFTPEPFYVKLGLKKANYTLSWFNPVPITSRGAVKIYIEMWFVNGLEQFPRDGWQKWDSAVVRNVRTPPTNVDTAWTPQNLVKMDPAKSGVMWPADAAISYGGAISVVVTWSPGAITTVAISPPQS
jgi:hypothetical protein